MSTNFFLYVHTSIFLEFVRVRDVPEQQRRLGAGSVFDIS
jgi:hypothetical protein